MKIFAAAALVLSMLAMLAMPAHAQARRPHGEEKKARDDRPKVDEKAYKAALERIPEPKEKYDPWAVAKPAEPQRNRNDCCTGLRMLPATNSTLNRAWNRRTCN